MIRVYVAGTIKDGGKITNLEVQRANVERALEAALGIRRCS